MYITDREISSITTKTMLSLKKEKRVTVTITPLHGEKYWAGGINGHFFRLPTGVPVEVPESLKTLIESGNRVRVEVSGYTAPYGGNGRKLG